jgi:hypothetical protein
LRQASKGQELRTTILQRKGLSRLKGRGQPGMNLALLSTSHHKLRT